MSVTVDRDSIVRDIASILEIDATELGADANPYDLGMDSVRLMTLVDKWGVGGIGITVAQLAPLARIGDWMALLEDAARAGTAPARRADPWLRRFDHVRTEPRVLVGCPYGGASASGYRRLSRELAETAPMLAIQYPGRQDRTGESFCTTIEELADGVSVALAESAPASVVLFGHCMGALVAYETARRLRDAGVTVDALVVSGSQAPHRVGAVDTGASEGRERRDMSALGGTDTRILSDPDLMEFFLPALRADYAAVDVYRHMGGDLLTVPVTVVAGTDDPRVSEDGLAAWSEVSSGPIRAVRLPGEHFYFAEDPTGLAEVLREVWHATR